MCVNVCIIRIVSSLHLQLARLRMTCSAELCTMLASEHIYVMIYVYASRRMPICLAPSTSSHRVGSIGRAGARAGLRCQLRKAKGARRQWYARKANNARSAADKSAARPASYGQFVWRPPHGSRLRAESHVMIERHDEVRVTYFIVTYFQIPTTHNAVYYLTLKLLQDRKF